MKTLPVIEFDPIEEFDFTDNYWNGSYSDAGFSSLQTIWCNGKWVFTIKEAKYFNLYLKVGSSDVLEGIFKTRHSAIEWATKYCESVYSEKYDIFPKISK